MVNYPYPVELEEHFTLCFSFHMVPGNIIQWRRTRGGQREN